MSGPAHQVNDVIHQLIGETNLLTATVGESENAGHVIVKTDAGEFAGRLAVEGWMPGKGDQVSVSVRPEAVRIEEAVNGSEGEIMETTYLGEMIQYQVRMVSGLELRVSEMNPRRVMGRGAGVRIEIHPEDVVVLRE